MSITATSVTPENTLEEFRIQFNKLVVDVDGVASGNTFTQSIIFEGATADESETTLLATDPTADRTITLPDASVSLTCKSSSPIPALAFSFDVVIPFAIKFVMNTSYNFSFEFLLIFNAFKLLRKPPNG